MQPHTRHAPSRSIPRCALPLTLALFAACAESRPTGPGVIADAPVVARGGAGPRLATVSWNRFARDMVARRRIPPNRASRIYAHLSVAQERATEAVVAAGDAAPEPAMRAAVLGASARMLSHLAVTELGLGAEQASIDAEAQAWRDQLIAEGDGDVAAGEALGWAAAGPLVERARGDRAFTPWTGTVPTCPECWAPAPGTAPAFPHWGQVQPWLMTSGSQFRAPPPAPVASTDFQTELEEVRAVSDARTAEQLQVAIFWNDGPGTFTPPGRWNLTADQLVREHHLNERRAAAVFSMLNRAIADALIACWDSKYHYWLLRPYDADPEITTPIGKPAHPSYPSGHSCNSGAGANVLGTLFPERREEMLAMMAAGSLSRLYGGIHFRMDLVAGEEIGRAVAGLATAGARTRGSTKP